MNQSAGRDQARLLSEIRQLEDEIVARDQFMTVAAHELRNPLHAVAMQIQAVHMMAVLRGERAIADRLHEASRNLESFIQRSTIRLDASRIASGLHRLELGPVDLREVIDHVRDLYLRMPA